MRARRAVCAVLLLPVFAVVLALALFGCASAPPVAAPPALLERPERPVLANAEEVVQAVKEENILALTQLYGRNMAELMAYARKLEALLDAIERQE